MIDVQTQPNSVVKGSSSNKKEYYIKYSKAIIKVRENNKVTKLACNLPLHTEELDNLNKSYMVANHIVYLYSNVLADNVEIIEVSIKLSNNRIVLYEVSGNKYLNLKKISFDSDQTLDKNMEGLLV